MKKTLLICLTAALFCGCSKKDVKPAAQNYLFGKWQYKMGISSIYREGQLVSADTAYLTDLYIQFNSDNTGIDIDVDKNAQSNFTFIVKDKDIIFNPSNGGFVDTLTIRSITATKLVAGRHYDFSGGDGIMLNQIGNVYFDKVK